MEINNTAAAGSGSTTGAASVSLAKNFDMFLKLLTTELQHQDPLEPMDSNEFTNQLVQFSNVEQSINTNTNLEKLIAMAAAGQSSNLVNYLCKTVDVASNATTLGDGAASWTYELSANTDTTRLLVLDANDQVVRIIDGKTVAGTHKLVWDGTGDAGQVLPDGTYRLTVSARDADARQVDASVTTRGLVTAVETVNDQNLLTVGGTKVPLSDVLSVSIAEAN